MSPPTTLSPSPKLPTSRDEFLKRTQSVLETKTLSGVVTQVISLATSPRTEIADLAVETLGLPAKPAFDYTGGPRGWRGDVPVVRLDSTRIRSLGWFPKRNSREAVRHSLQELMADERTIRN